jgi:transposase InsO family protein
MNMEGDAQRRFRRARRLERSMSRNGNSRDDEVAEAFLGIPTQGRVNKNVCKTSGHSRADMFNCVEPF